MILSFRENIETSFSASEVDDPVGQACGISVKRRSRSLNNV